jgi:hypothetical protein
MAIDRHPIDDGKIADFTLAAKYAKIQCCIDRTKSVGTIVPTDEGNCVKFVSGKYQEILESTT